jgi:hypothetical protein
MKAIPKYIFSKRIFQKLVLITLALLMLSITISPVLASTAPATPASPAPQAAQSDEKPPAEPSAATVEYKDTKYGFSFSLPASWKGYKIVAEKWEGSDTRKGDIEHGPLLYIRHPAWTKENPREDIPIMIFTVSQWESVQQGNYLVNAAPISPNELGRNRKYVFALPPRANYADLTGVEEVDDILRHGPLHPFWSK